MTLRDRIQFTEPPLVIKSGIFDREYPFGSGKYINPYTIDYNTVSNGRGVMTCTRCLDEIHQGPPYKRGGPLDVWTMSDGGLELRDSKAYHAILPSEHYRYRGGFICSLSPSVISSRVGVALTSNYPSQSNSGSSYGDVSQYGASAWNRFKPGRSAAGVSQFLAEIREAPAMLMNTARYYRDLWRVFKPSRRKQFKVGRKLAKTPDEWVNIQFGWMPFISDLRQFYQAYNKIDKTLTYIREHNDKWIKRGGRFLLNEDVVLKYQGIGPAHWPDLGIKFNLTGSRHLISLVDKQDVWFTARFKYYIPNIESNGWKGKAVAELFGAVPHPDLIWELTPWSWLIDWHSNLGDVISNYTNNGWAENLVSKYAYIMGSRVTTARVDSTYNIRGGPSKQTWDYEISRKTRREANPFGFNLSMEDLTMRQWSILTALGFSRLKGWWERR